MSPEPSIDTEPQTPSEAPSRPAPAMPLGINDVQRLLPHRYPFLLIDGITAFEPRKRIVAKKNVTVNEPYFQGHFPGHPIMPGVLLLECMAQAGAVMIMLDVERQDDKLIFFTGVERARFRRPVVPGDQLRIEVDVLSWRSTSGKMDGRVYVEDRLVAEAIITCHVVMRER